MITEIHKLVGKRIRDLRKERGISQEQLGEKGGFHYSYIGQIERGEKNIALTNLTKIAEALDVNISQLFTYVDIEQKTTQSEADIQELTSLLRNNSPKNIRLIRDVIKGILEINS